MTIRVNIEGQDLVRGPVSLLRAYHTSVASSVLVRSANYPVGLILPGPWRRRKGSMAPGDPLPRPLLPLSEILATSWLHPGYILAAQSQELAKCWPGPGQCKRNTWRGFDNGLLSVLGLLGPERSPLFFGGKASAVLGLNELAPQGDGWVSSCGFC